MREEIKEQCYHSMDLNVENHIDRYDYHDAPTIICFRCDFEKGHEGMHSEKVMGKRIYWE